MNIRNYVSAVAALSSLFGSAIVWAQTQGSAAAQPASPAATMTQDPTRIAMFSLLAAALVVVLLISGFLALTFGLFSKRPADRHGGRTPSDIGLLQGNIWPQEPAEDGMMLSSDADSVQAKIAHAKAAHAKIADATEEKRVGPGQPQTIGEDERQRSPYRKTG